VATSYSKPNGFDSLLLGSIFFFEMVLEIITLNLILHIFFLDGRPTGPALLKKQNVDWGYQFYRAAA
jgi:hypothetical protein